FRGACGPRPAHVPRQGTPGRTTASDQLIKRESATNVTESAARFCGHNLNGRPRGARGGEPGRLRRVRAQHCEAAGPSAFAISCLCYNPASLMPCWSDVLIMKVVLQEDVKGLGVAGDVKDVADGYARNFLIPRRLAAPATSGALKNVEAQRAAAAK